MNLSLKDRNEIVRYHGGSLLEPGISRLRYAEIEAYHRVAKRLDLTDEPTEQPGYPLSPEVCGKLLLKLYERGDSHIRIMRLLINKIGAGPEELHKLAAPLIARLRDYKTRGDIIGYYLGKIGIGPHASFINHKGHEVLAPDSLMRVFTTGAIECLERLGQVYENYTRISKLLKKAQQAEEDAKDRLKYLREEIVEAERIVNTKESLAVPPTLEEGDIYKFLDKTIQYMEACEDYFDARLRATSSRASAISGTPIAVAVTSALGAQSADVGLAKTLYQMVWGQPMISLILGYYMSMRVNEVISRALQNLTMREIMQQLGEGTRIINEETSKIAQALESGEFNPKVIEETIVK